MLNVMIKEVTIKEIKILIYSTMFVNFTEYITSAMFDSESTNDEG